MIIVGIVFVVVAVSGFGVWYVYGSGRSDPGFRTEEVKRGDLLATISASGTVEPVDIVDVGAQVTGQVIAYGEDDKGNPINYGSVVHPDRTLAKIDPKLYQAKVDQSQANVRQADAKVTEAKAHYDQSVAKVDEAKANVKVADAKLAQAKAQFDQANRDWDRARLLKPQQSIAQADYDASESAYYTNKANVGVSDASLAQAKVMVADAEADAENSKAAIADAQAAVENAKAILKQDDTNLGYCDIKSSVEGVVIDRRVTLGQTVQSSFNTPSLFLLALDLKKMNVWASVNEADIGQVREGQTVKFTVDAHPEEVFTGTVNRIRLNATSTQNVVTYTVEVLTDNPPDKDHPNGKLLPYLTANLRFEVDKRSNVLMVSNEALRWRPDVSQVSPDARAAYQKFLRGKDDESAAGDGKSTADTKPKGGKSQHRGTVWVQDGKFVRPVKVRLGLSDGTRTEILEGNLQEGMTIISGDAPQGGGGAGATNPFAPQMFGGQRKSS
jgi:HlyD family secretion protein